MDHLRVFSFFGRPLCILFSLRPCEIAIHQRWPKGKIETKEYTKNDNCSATFTDDHGGFDGYEWIDKRPSAPSSLT
jgi:hypothetical protein